MNRFNLIIKVNHGHELIRLLDNHSICRKIKQQNILITPCMTNNIIPNIVTVLFRYIECFLQHNVANVRGHFIVSGNAAIL